MKKHDLGVFLISVFAILSAGCNVFSSLDRPSTDSQILASARACFDAGDFTCALSLYGQVSSAYADPAISESVFVTLSRHGMSSSVFINAATNASNGSTGKMITQLAGRMSLTASAAVRLDLFRAYKRHTEITDTRLRGLVRFLGSLTLLAEFLGEDATTRGIFLASDFASDANTCKNLNAGASETSIACDPPAGKTITRGTTLGTTLPNVSEAQITAGAPTLYWINTTIQEITDGLAQMQSSGGVGSNSQSFANTIVGQAGDLITTFNGRSYRWLLLNQEIGAQ